MERPSPCKIQGYQNKFFIRAAKLFHHKHWWQRIRKRLVKTAVHLCRWQSIAWRATNCNADALPKRLVQKSNKKWLQYQSFVFRKISQRGEVTLQRNKITESKESRLREVRTQARNMIRNQNWFFRKSRRWTGQRTCWSALAWCSSSAGSPSTPSTLYQTFSTCLVVAHYRKYKVYCILIFQDTWWPYFIISLNDWYYKILGHHSFGPILVTKRYKNEIKSKKI